MTAVIAFLAPQSALSEVVPEPFVVESAAIDGASIYVLTYVNDGNAQAVVRFDLASGLSQTLLTWTISDLGHANPFRGSIDRIKARNGRVALRLVEHFAPTDQRETSLLTMHADGSGLEQIHKTTFSIKTSCGEVSELMGVSDDGAVVFADQPAAYSGLVPQRTGDQIIKTCAPTANGPYFAVYEQHVGTAAKQLVRVHQPRKQTFHSAPWADVRVAGSYLLVIGGTITKDRAQLWDWTSNRRVAVIQDRRSRGFSVQDVDAKGRVLVVRNLAKAHHKAEYALQLIANPLRLRRVVTLRRSAHMSGARFCGDHIVELFAGKRLVLRSGDGESLRTIAGWRHAIRGNWLMPDFDCTAATVLMRIPASPTRSRWTTFDLD